MTILWVSDFDFSYPSTGLEIPPYYLTKKLSEIVKVVNCYYSVDASQRSEMNRISRNLHVISSVNELNQLIKSEGVNTCIMDFTDKKLMHQIKKVMKDTNISLFYIRDSMLASAISKFKYSNYSLLFKIRLIITGIIYEYTNKYNSFDGVIFVNERDSLISRKLFPLNNCNFYSINNGVDLDKFKKSFVEKKDLKILFVGPADYFPNLNTTQYIINDIAPYFENKKNIKFIIVGKNYEKYLTDIPSNVLIKGYVDDLVKQYNEADIFLAPIQIGAGIKNKVLEAMACELPVIGSNEALSGIEYEQNINAIVCEGKQSYIKAIEHLINNKEVRISIGHNARELMESKYTWDSAVEEIININNKLINKRNI